jgi:hypothetical protein
MVSMNRVNPAKDVQSLTMLTPGPDDRLPTGAPLAPCTSKFWMEAKTSFIFKDYDLPVAPVTNGLEFFLTQNGMFSLLSAMPAHSDTSVASMQTPVHVTISGLAARECSRYGHVSGTPRQQLRPNEPAGVQIPWEKTAALSPNLACMNHSGVMGDQGVPDLPRRPSLRRWHVGSTLQSPPRANQQQSRDADANPSAGNNFSHL